ncbi:MAG: hypothetical protein RIT23_561, partial [Actinomycetota bacterium]
RKAARLVLHATNKTTQWWACWTTGAVGHDDSHSSESSDLCPPSLDVHINLRELHHREEPSGSRFKKWNCAPQRRRSTNTKRIALPTSNPTPCITMNIGTDSGAMPANELLKLRAIDTAGFASDVDEVNQ